MIIKGKKTKHISFMCGQCIYVGSKYIEALGKEIDFIYCPAHPSLNAPCILDNERGDTIDSVAMERIPNFIVPHGHDDLYWTEFRQAYGEMYDLAVKEKIYDPEF